MLAGLLGLYAEGALLTPLARLPMALPQLDVAAGKANTGGDVTVEVGADVVAAQNVCLLERLDKRVRNLFLGALGVDRLAASAVDLDAGRSRGGQQVVRRGCQREDVGGMSVRSGIVQEIFLGLGGV